MKFLSSIAIVSILVALTGCGAMIQNVELAKTEPTKKIETVSQVLHVRNSTAMNDNLQSALKQEGLIVKAPLPTGTITSNEVDALVSYDDAWVWDFKMYLAALSIHIYDAKTGDLLAIGYWQNSRLHRWPDSAEVMQGLVTDMMARLRGSPKESTK